MRMSDFSNLIQLRTLVLLQKDLTFTRPSNCCSLTLAGPAEALSQTRRFHLHGGSFQSVLSRFLKLGCDSILKLAYRCNLR